MPKKESEYNYNYTKSNYDTIKVLTPKGTRERLKTEAEKRGLQSVNALLNLLIAQILSPDPPAMSGEIHEDAEQESDAEPED